MKSDRFPITRAIALELAKLNIPIVLRYDIGRITWHLYKTGTYEGQRLSTKNDVLNVDSFNYIEQKLQDNGVLKPLLGLPKRTAYELIGANITDRNTIVCSIDPFCYLSHLSAMEFHGLTDRMPEHIYISTPPSKEWVSFATEKMKKDLEEDFKIYRESGLPLLHQITRIKIGRRSVHRYASTHRGAFRTIKGSPIRVSTIGRTFLDMLQKPALCGGIDHVIHVFKEHSAINKRLIFDELDQHGSPIDKVRAGFILEDICHIQDPRINAWIKFAARGGSRKLDPSADYEPKFSERWMLSINIPVPNE